MLRILAALLALLFPASASAAILGPALAAAGAFLVTYGGTILTVASLATSIVLAFVGPRGPGVEGPRLGDTRVQTSAYGGSIPHAFGRVRMAGNVIWVKGNQLDEVRRRDEVGGKGGGTKQTTYQYFVTCAIKFAEADPEATAFTRLWAAKKLIYDRTGASSTTSKYPNADFRFYLGTSDQDPDPSIEAEQGVGSTPGFRGSIYLVVENLPLADFGNFLPDIEAEIQFATPVETQIIDLSDMNNFAVRDIEVEQNTYAMYLLRRTDIVTTDNSTQIHRFDLATNTLTASTLVTHGANQHGIGSSGLRPRVILPGPDGKLLCMSRENFGASRWLVDLNPFTLQVNKAIDFTQAPLSQGGNFNERAAITWKQAVSGGTEVFSLVSFNGEGGGLPDTDDNDWYVVHRRSLIDGNGEFGFTGIHFDLTRDVNGSLELGSSTVDKNGDIWLVGRHTGVNDNSFGNQALMWRLRVIQNVDDDGDPFEAYFLPTVDEIDLLALEPRLNDPTLVIYDRPTHSLVIFGDQDGTDNDYRIVRYDIATGTILASVTEDAGLAGGPRVPDADFDTKVNDDTHPRSTGQVGFRNGVFKYAQRGGGGSFTGDGTHTWCEIDVDDLSIRTFEGPGVDATNNPSKFFWHQDSDSLYSFAERAQFEDPKRFNTFSVVPVPDSLNEVLDVILKEVRLDPTADASYDAGVLAAEVQGYIMSQQASARDVLEPLLFAYPTDVVESDGKLKFVTRGGASIRNISQDDLGANSREPAKESLITTRIQEVELPERVDVRFLDFDRDYQENTEQADRHRFPNSTQEAGNHFTQNLPIVMTPTEAQAAAESQLLDAWAARLGYEFQLGTKHLDLDPTDIITLQIDDLGDIVAKVGLTELSEAWVTKFQAGVNDSEVFDVEDLIVSTPFPDQSVGLPGPTEPFFLDLPYLRDIDSQAKGGAMYAGAGHILPDWRGGVITKSIFGDAGPFENFATFRDGLIWGYITEDIPGISDVSFQPNTGPPNDGFSYGPEIGTIDQLGESPITVQIVEGLSRLANTTEDLIVSSSANAFVIINVETENILSPEVSHFTSFTDNGDGTVTLTGLLRCSRGTEESTGNAGFPAGSLVVFLDQDIVDRENLDLETDYEFPRLYHALSLGQPFDTAVLRSFTYRARDLLPLPVNPIYVDQTAGAGRTGSVVVTWERRTRVGGDLDFGDGVLEPPLSENDEEYEVDLLTTGGAVSITKTTTSDATGVTFTAGERNAAGWATADPFDVNIYQMTTINEQSVRGMRRQGRGI